jgi:tetratricopeptide (TPR) repeat protein
MLAFVLLLSVASPSPAIDQENLPSLIKKAAPSIVVILTYDREGKLIGQGSGFFASKQGEVITNYHVLHEASHAEVRTSDGQTYPIRKVVAEDAEGDVIRVSVDIPEEAVQPLSISSTLPEVGERIVVIGTPLGFEKTVSDGIVSAVREVPKFGKIIQLTAPISSGSSGSPVLNMKGEVVGIAAFFVMPGQNLNFAIPGEKVLGLKREDEKSLSEREKMQREDRLASAEGFYATGLRYLWIEDCEKAILYFAETVRRNPNQADAYFQIGYCSGRLGRYQEAIEPYRQALRLKPEDADTYSNLCAAYGMLGRYDEAVASCKRAIQLKSDLAEAYNNLGWTYQKLGRHHEAVASCKEAIHLKPDFAQAHYNLGNNYFALKKYGAAIESYKETIRIKFDYAEGHLNLGGAYFEMGRFEEAIESFKQAILLKPLLGEAHLNLGMAYLKLGDRGAAIEEYRILKDVNKSLGDKLFNLIYE